MNINTRSNGSAMPLALLAVFSLVSAATAAVPTDVAGVITDSTSVFTSVSALAVVILLFGIAVRLVRKFVK